MASNPATADDEIQEHMNGINEDLLKGMLHTERACGSKFRNPWSPALIQGRDLVRYWESWMTQLKTGHDLTNQRHEIVCCLPKAPITPEPRTRAVIHKHLRLARKNLQLILRKADKLRDQFLEEQSSHYASVNQLDASKILDNMQRAESSRRIYARFCLLMGKAMAGALSSLKVPNPQASSPDTEYITIYDPDEIECRLLECNQQHFSQASGTPFIIAPQSTNIGQNAEHGFPGALLALSHATDEATIALLEQALAYELPKILCQISTDEVITKFRVWKEQLPHHHTVTI